MILSNELFIWEVGDIGRANWKAVNTTSNVEFTGTIEVQLTSCTGASGLVSLINYNHKIYLVSRYSLTDFSYNVSGSYYSNGTYSRATTTEYRLSNGYVYEPLEDNGIIAVADNTYSIPYVITAGESLTIQELFDWWYKRIKHGAVSEGATALGYNPVAGSTTNGNVQIEDIVYTKGEGALAAGVRPVASGVGSVAVGIETEAAGTGAIAGGYASKANGDNSVALGSKNKANGDNSIAAGYDNIAAGQGSIAVGLNNSASEDGAVAIGSQNSAEGDAAVALGSQNVASGDYSVATGSHSAARGAFSQAGGDHSIAEGHANVALGDHITTHGKYQVGLGRYNDPGSVDPVTGLPQYLFTLGDGNSEETRHNAFGIFENGGFFYKGTDGELHIFNEQICPGPSSTDIWWISRVQRLSDTRYEIDATNGLETLTTHWNVTYNSNDDVVWVSDTGQVIDMLGFDDTSEYRITEVERINDSQYKMTAQNKNGGTVVNIWTVEETVGNITTWRNTSSPESDPIEIDFKNFDSDNIDIANHTFTNYTASLTTLSVSEDNVKSMRLSLTPYTVTLTHTKRS